MRILITESSDYNPAALKLYRSHGTVDMLSGEKDAIFRALPQADVVVVRLMHQIDRAFFDQAQKLRYLITPTTGLTHIDQDCAAQNSVQVLSLKGEAEFLRTVTATAELAWALLLNLTRNTLGAVRHVEKGRWDRDLFRGTELKGKTLGIVGYGRLGRLVANYGLTFGMNVIAYDPYVHEFQSGVASVSFDDLLGSADVVSVHAALTDETRLMFTEAEFAKLKKGAIFINTARGEVLCEHAFVDARKSGRISAAGFDVLADERGIDGGWLAKSPIAKLAKHDPRIIITPHIGGCTLESMHKTELRMAEKFSDAVRVNEI